MPKTEVKNGKLFIAGVEMPETLALCNPNQRGQIVGFMEGLRFANNLTRREIKKIVGLIK